MRVCKFGGSSLSTAAGFAQVRRLIAEQPARRVIVPSAPGKRDATDEKITDLLYACHSAAAGGRAFQHIFDRVAQRYRQIAREADIAAPDDDLRAVYAGIKGGASAAWAASRGEWLCARMLSAYLDLPFLDAAEVIRFDDKGHLQTEETQALLRRRLAEGCGAVLPGFYGAGAAGEIYTFARGGSDITGALAAAALNADVYENFKDVRGVYAADPALVPDARIVADMTYRELRAFSRLGAQVLHEEAVAPVRQAGVPLCVRSSFDVQHPGTWVHAAFGTRMQAAAIGVTGWQGLTLLRLERLDGGFDLARCALAANLPVRRLAADEDALCLLLPGQADWQALTQGARRVHTQTHLAALSVVGEGLARLEAAARLSAALNEAGVRALALHQPPEGLYITALIGQEDYSPALRAAYDAFIRL